jgi:8-oxo-dGTP pyrophosphatase MutT (NUDIX family)
MATLYKHGPIIGIYLPKTALPTGARLALFENGTVLRNRRRGAGWEMTAFNAQRLLHPAGLIEPDHSPAAAAIMTRTKAAAHVHAVAKRSRAIARRAR